MTTKTIVIPKGEKCCVCKFFTDVGYEFLEWSCLLFGEEICGYLKCQQCLDKTEVNIEYEKE